MTAFLVLSAVVFFAIGTAAYPRTRKLFIERAAKPKALLAPESQALKDWKKIFRETVISVDGSLSPELKSFLSEDDDRASAVLAEARKSAEQERAEILKKAEEERASLLKENEDWVINDRLLLVGPPRREYEDDFGAAQSPIERGDVIKRWHAKGFRFSRELRASLLSGASNEETRRMWRAMFDEQDKSEKKS